MNKLFTIILFFNFLSLHAQITEPVYKNQVKWSPFRLMDIRNPGLEISYERIYAKKHSTQLALAYMTDPLQATDFKNYEGGRIALEQKYFYMRKKYLATYFSAELVYSKTKFEQTSRFVNTTGGYYAHNYSQSYVDTFSVNKQMFTFNLKGGIQFTLKHVMFDFCAGLGLKYRDIENAHRFNSKDLPYAPIDLNVNYIGNNLAKHGYTITIPLNAKVGFLF